MNLSDNFTRTRYSDFDFHIFFFSQGPIYPGFRKLLIYSARRKSAMSVAKIKIANLPLSIQNIRRLIFAILDAPNMVVIHFQNLGTHGWHLCSCIKDSPSILRMSARESPRPSPFEWFCFMSPSQWAKSTPLIYTGYLEINKRSWEMLKYLILPLLF